MRTPKEPGTEVAVRTAAPASMPFAEMEALAQAIAKSQLFGIKTPDQALVLMAISQAEGRHPALAARDYDIIQGRPAKKAEAMMRDFLASGGRVEWHQIDDDVADATFSHPQGGEARIKWDMARVKKARISNAEMYAKYPRAMLRSRVVSEGVRTVCPAATGGFYVGEEAADIEPREAIDVTPKGELDAFAQQAAQPAGVVADRGIGWTAAESPVEAHKRIYAEEMQGFNPAAKAEDAADQAVLLQEAEGAARLGLEGFRNWWKTLNATERATVEPHLDRLEKLVQAPKRVTIQDQPTQHHVVEAAPKPGAAAPKPQPAATVDPPQPPQVPPQERPDYREIRNADYPKRIEEAPNPNAFAPPQVFGFTNADGEIFEFDSVLDAVSALMVVLDDARGTKAAIGIWESATKLRELVRGNGNLGAELDAAYARAVGTSNEFDLVARTVALGGLRKFHQWWLRLEPVQRKELAARRQEYEELARGAKT